MISRRNIRVKVLQCLYAMRTGNELPFPNKVQMVGQVRTGNAANMLPKAEVMLRRQFDLTLSLFAWQIWYLTEVARYAETDARLRGAKHIPNAEDLNVPVKIAGNELLWRILESNMYKQGLEQYGSNFEASADHIKASYQLLTQSTPYAIYNASPGRDKKSEKEIFEFIYSDLMLANEDWVAHAEEGYGNWDDDAEMLQQLMQQYLQKPGTWQLFEMINAEKFKFATELLESTEEKQAQIDEWIKPRLKNWDADRLAQLDLIMIQMGVAEFLYFETIPLKVTINEYIDLAKAYSTTQSGQFVNGILDNVRKELEAQGKIHKVSFKKPTT